MGLKGFVGVMDELRIYSRGFKPKEIEELFELEPGKPQSVSPIDSLATTLGAIRQSR